MTWYRPGAEPSSKQMMIQLTNAYIDGLVQDCSNSIANALELFVENECCCTRTVNISNVNFTSKISIPPEPVFQNMGQQMSGPDSSNG